MQLTIKPTDSPQLAHRKRVINEAFREEPDAGLYVFSLDQFPHWNRLRAGEALSFQQLDERQQAMEYALHVATKKKVKLDWYKPTKTTPFLSWEEKIVHKLDARELTGPTSTGIHDAKKRPCVFPYPLSPQEGHIEVIQKALFCLFLPSPKEKPVHICSQLMGIPSSAFSYTPPLHDILFFFSHHERRHAQQLYKRWRSDETRYYEELDADEAATKDNPQLKQDVVWMRYVNILRSIPYYWNAPTLEKGSKKRRWTYLDDISSASMVYDHVDAHVRYAEKRRYPSLAQCPAEIKFPSLRHLVHTGVFENVVRAQETAEKILSGVEHYCSGLSFEKRVPTRRVFDIGRGAAKDQRL